MKYKVLITGKNTTIIDDFFIHMNDDFEIVSTSTRFGDIIRHVKYFRPDLFVYCLNGESRESISQMSNIKHSSFRTQIPVVVLGSKEECDEFEKIALNVANLVLVKPFTAVSIQEDILKFMEEREEYFGKGEKKKADDISESESAAESSAGKAAKTAAQAESVHTETAQPETPQKAERLSAGEKPSTQPAEPSSPAKEPAQRKHILVVDDDPLMLKLLKDHLHNEFDVATAVSGKIAIKFLERKKTNLILLDYEMPGETGPEVLEKLRANDATKDIPVIFLTGVSEREKIQEALGLKPQGYLLKPIDHEKLLDSILKVIG